MDYEKEIPFGAFDSELMYQEIYIPEGFKATIKGNRIILKKIESEDEKIRKALVRFHKSTIDIDGIKGADILAWLEKQGQTFTKKDVDDAYLKGICDAKHELEKQGEQKTAVIDFKAKNWYVSKVDGKIHDMTYNPTDKVEPKFKVGDVLCDKSCTTLNKNSQPNIKILDIRNDMYICNNCSFPISQQDEYELVAKRIEPQSAAWSDEDEEMAEDLIKGCVSAEKAHYFLHTPKEIADWLKSLKNRIGG